MRGTVTTMAAVEVLDTDITTLDVDAIANAANTRSARTAAASRARSRAPAARVQDESDAKAPIGLGEAVETTRRRHAVALGHPRRHDGARRPDDADIIRRATAATLAAADDARRPQPRAGRVRHRRRRLPARRGGADRGRGGPPAPRRRLAPRARRLRRPRRAGARARSRPRWLERAAGGRARAAGGAAAPPHGHRAAARPAARRAAPRRAPSSASRARATRDARSRSRSPPATACCSPPRRSAAAFRADPEAIGERAWLLVAAVIAALVDLAEPGAARRRPTTSRLRAGDLGGFLLLGLPGRARPGDARGARAARVRGPRRRHRPAARARARRPRRVLGDAPGAARADRRRTTRCAIAEAVARLGGRPEDPRSVEEHEEAVLALLGARGGRVARRTRTPIRPAASPAGSSSGSTAWASGAATTPTSPTSPAASPATSARSPRRWGRRCSRPGCWPRSRRSASATCSSTRGGRPRSAG